MKSKAMPMKSSACSPSDDSFQLIVALTSAARCLNCFTAWSTRVFGPENRMLMSELETNAARLMYGSSVMGVPLSSYYFALKFLRRKLSEINRETLCRDEQVNLPPSVLRSFKNWQNDVMARKRRQLPKLSGKKSFTLWTDASNLGWGAVLIDNDTQQVKVVGARWTEDEAMFHINILEAMAVKKALRAFQGLEGSVIQPRIDNTSVLASVVYSTLQGDVAQMVERPLSMREV